MNPNIMALQAAEKLLRDHDVELKELADQIKEKKKERLPLVARVQECIDVLCGRKSPDLFAAVEETAAPTHPLGELRSRLLTDLVSSGPGHAVAVYLSVQEEVGTLGDLWDWVEEDGAEDGGMRGHGLDQLLKSKKVGSPKQIRTFLSCVYAALHNHGVLGKEAA